MVANLECLLCVRSVLSTNKTELFSGKVLVSPGSLQDGKLTITGHLYTKWFDWKPLSEAKAESNFAVQEPLIPTRAAKSLLQ